MQTILLFRPANYFAEMFDSFKPYIDQIRTKENWKRLGFKIRIEKGHFATSIVRNGQYYWFELVDDGDLLRMDDEQTSCYKQSKRFTQRPIDIYSLIKQGFILEEFYYNNKSLPYYFQAIDAFEAKNYKSCVYYLNSAISFNKHNDYVELKEDALIELFDVESAIMMFNNYKERLDGFVHCSKIYKWLKYFIMNEQFDTTKNYIEYTINQLEYLSSINKEKIDFPKLKLEEFKKNLHKTFNHFAWSKFKDDHRIKALIDYLKIVYTGENKTFKKALNL